MINTFKQKIVNSIVKTVNESGGKIEPKTKIKIITTDQELNEIIETVELIKITVENNKTYLTIRYPEYNEETKRWMLEEDSKKENTFDINEMSLQELTYLMEKMQYTNANGEEKTYTEVIADKVKIINENDSTPELNKNSIDIWIWWCHNFTHPNEFIKRITDGECMRKHLSNKWKEKYNMYGPVAAMQQFYLDLDNKHRARLLDYIDSIKKDRI